MPVLEDEEAYLLMTMALYQRVISSILFSCHMSLIIHKGWEMWIKAVTKSGRVLEIQDIREGLGPYERAEFCLGEIVSPNPVGHQACRPFFIPCPVAPLRFLYRGLMGKGLTSKRLHGG